MKTLIEKTKICLLVCFLMLSVSTMQSCKKLIEVPGPATSLNASNVYENDATAIAAVTGIYADMSGYTFGNASLTSISLYMGLASDEFQLSELASNTALIQYYKNDLHAESANGDLWLYAYRTIYYANAALDGLQSSTKLTPGIKKELIAEIKFNRALSFFYLENEYGDVPLPLTGNYAVNSALSRSKKTDVITQIIKDLQEAIADLPSNYVDGTILGQTSERTRPNKWVATALLSRVYLYNNDYQNAEKLSTELINNTTQFSLESLNDVFLANSNEAIWQLQPTIPGNNTSDAQFFILPSSGPDVDNNPAYLSQGLMASFETGDRRRHAWVDSVNVTESGVTKTFYYPYKYKINVPGSAVTEYLMVFRLAEQYLIRAESRAKLGNDNSAIVDLNIIRHRAGLPDAIGLSGTTLLDAILHERRIEFFSEWAHRWFDLKRLNQLDQIMPDASVKKGGVWKSTDQLLPIPSTDIVKNKNLTQNSGY